MIKKSIDNKDVKKNNDVEPVNMEVKMKNVEPTNNESRTTAANLFPIHRVELKGMNTTRPLTL